MCTDSGNPANALYGSFLPIPEDELFPLEPEELYSAANAAGAVVCKGEPIKLNQGRKRVKIRVTNTGDRPVQVRLGLGDRAACPARAGAQHDGELTVGPPSFVRRALFRSDLVSTSVVQLRPCPQD